MEAINEFTGLKISSRIVRFVTDIVENILIYGYTNSSKDLSEGLFIMADGNSVTSYYDPNHLHLDWSPYFQKYYCLLYDCKDNPSFLIDVSKSLKPGVYSYSFERKYEAVQNFKLFDNKQLKIESEEFPIAKHVKRTIGIEFETSLGYISERDCFNYGLIPLRDGSISGIEYSTVILQGNSGFNLLKKQLDLLRNYTHFNKECSLHIHFGNFPLDVTKISRLYTILLRIQDQMEWYVPALTFRTNEYKANGKSYCKKLPEFANFDNMFYNFTSMPFLGSFVQPHPDDLTRTHKWNVHSRYYWCNFVNLLCYNVNKTVEFRFLRPTYNLEKILTWIYILNGILTYAEGNGKIQGIDLKYILNSVYPTDTANMLHYECTKLVSLQKAQYDNGDLIGADLTLENRFFESNKII